MENTIIWMSHYWRLEFSEFIPSFDPKGYGGFIKPNVVVLQSGADSLAGDILGCFNLFVKGHAQLFEIPQIL